MKLESALFGLFAVPAVVYATRQHPLHTPNPASRIVQSGDYDADAFTPVGSLRALSTSQFTTLTHPLLPHLSARIKKTDWCDDQVGAFTGYIDNKDTGKHLFFSFFESRNDPDEDDIIFWTNGGPGCSSSFGVVSEHGPCRVENTTFGPAVKHNDDAWNSKANIFFVDQPVGVGFSYAEFGQHVGTTAEAAQDIAAFMVMFFEHFLSFKGRPLHMAGESYGGRYIPMFASAVHDQNAALEKSMRVNLKSVLIGNGLTDPLQAELSFYDLACTSASGLPPTLDVSTCARMSQAVKRCETLMTEACVNAFDRINCEGAESFCSNELEVPLVRTGINLYDLSRPCEGGVENLCYPISKVATQYFSDPQLRNQLGVDAVIPEPFSVCSDQVSADFVASDDRFRSSVPYVAALLEHDVKVLLYVGEYDWICNWVGIERWSLAMEWSGHDAFNAQELKTWSMDGKVVGKTRSAQNLTFATIAGAGHMVPADKPKEALALLNMWLEGKVPA